jgi:type VI secretion system secreted protein VgrG
MDGAPTQDKRIAGLTTPLGKDVLVLTRFEGGEGLSELFEYRIDALSDRENIDFDGAIGLNCAVRFRTRNGAERFFNGVLTEAQWVGARDERFAYRLTLRPWLWLLGHRRDCRIFANMTAPDIVAKVFNDAGFSDFERSLTEDYPRIEYCVQYRETDLAFVSRLMEEFGIYHYFKHAADKHTLVLADAKSSHSAIPGAETTPYIPLSGNDRRDREHVQQWTSERRFRTGKVALNDYAYKQPNASLLSEAQGSEGYARSGLEAYDYPGRFDNAGDGQKLAKVRLEAGQALDHRRQASGDAISLVPGGLTSLQGHPSDDGQYLVARAAHSYASDQYRSGGGGADETYYGHYEFLPSDRPFRAPVLTPRPLVHGPQTAKVVGKEGEEIDVDEFGRITVQFHWDRDKKPSRRVRVAQVWSGKTWGGQIIPRIGQEVVVEFLEGDPDRPLVVGTVYNNDYKHPYGLPANKTQSGLKTESTKGGGGYNELMYEDKKGEEFVRFRAERDLKAAIRNTETREVGEVFSPARGSASRTVTLKNGDDVLKVEGGDLKVNVDSGDQVVDVAQNITVTAGMKITLKVGSSKITIDSQGIVVDAPKVEVKGVAQVEVKAPMTDVKGTGILQLQGGLVKIG